MTNERFLKMVTINGETWKPVPGYEEEFMVSSIGKVFMVGRYTTSKNGKVMHNEPRLLTWKITPHGYAQVHLWKNNEVKHMYVHRLVAMAFIPNPNDYPQIDRIDTDKLNNNVENLRWCNASMNHLNPITNARMKASLKGNQKLIDWHSKPCVGVNLFDESDVRFYKSQGETVKDGFNPSKVSAVCLKNRKHHRSFKFYYLSEYETLIKSKNEAIQAKDNYQQEQPPQLQEPQLPLQFEP